MRIRVFLAVLLVVFVLAACATPIPTPTPTPRPTATPAPTATPQPTATHTIVPTATHTTVPTPTPLPPPPPEPTKKSEPTKGLEVKPTWVVPISNAEAKYDPDNQVWQYYSTAGENKGEYVVSVRQNTKGEFEFYDFADKIFPPLHPEIFVKSTWAQMAARMKATGAVKALFFDIRRVRSLRVKRYTSEQVPAGLDIVFETHPVAIYYPYLKEGQASPGIPPWSVSIFGINEDVTRPIDLKAYDERGELRDMSPAEIMVGQYGRIVNLGDGLINLSSGSLVLLGRSIEDGYNRMLLDSFARDKNGRLMHP